MAGHSKWANIKHKKARNDAKRGKMWSKCSRAIIVAARQGGGDPDTNLSLRYAIDDAKSENMPKDTIEKAVQKGAGAGAGEDYVPIVYEGYGPNGVAIMLDILTDNRNRTAPEVRRIFEKYNGNLGATGCVAYLFTAKGEVYVPKSAADEDTVMTAGLDAGAEDIVDDGESWLLLCEPADFIPLKQALEAAELPIESSGISMIASTNITCTGKDVQKVLNLVEALEDHDDVQKVHANFDIPDEELAALE